MRAAQIINKEMLNQDFKPQNHRMPIPFAHRTVSRLEVGGVLHIAAKKRHGHVSQEVWSKIINALARHDVEMLPEDGNHGSGVRWMRARADRLSDTP